MRGWRGIWREIPEQTRREAAKAFWESEDEPLHALAVEILAAKYHFRPKSIRALPRTRKIEFFARRRDLNEDLIEHALVCLHVECRRPMMARFLDLVGLDHDDGLRQEVEDAEPVARDRLDGALERLYAEFARGDVNLYLDWLEARNDRTWDRLPEARRALAEEELRPAPVEHDEESEDAAETSTGEFSTLDRVLIDRIVAAAAAIEGDIDKDAAVDLVDEVLHLSPGRHHSYFHKGLCDVLLVGEPDVTFPEQNESRRGWYLAGAVSAYQRRGDHAAILRTLDAHAEDFSRIGAGQHPAAGLAVPILVDVLCSSGRAGEIVGLIQAPGAAAGWDRGVRGRLLREATAALRVQNADAAEPFLQLLTAAAQIRADQGLTPFRRFARELKRRQAHLLRLRGEWDEAERLIREVLDEGAGDRRAMLLADLGLLKCRYRALSEVRLPAEKIQLTERAQSLEPGREFFEQSAAEAGPGGHGEYCLGVLLLAGGDPEAALAPLERAVSRMEANPRLYSELGVLHRARIYLGCCLALSGEGAHAGHAVDCIEAGVRELPAETPYLVREALEALAIVAPARASDLLGRLRPLLGERLLDVAAEAGLLANLPELRRDLLARGKKSTRSPRERFDDCRTVLQASNEAGDEESALAALDALEALAAGGRPAERFVELLENPDLIKTHWEPGEIRMAKVRILEARGDYAAAATILQDEAHALLASGDWAGLRDAQGIVHQIRSYGLEPDEGLVARVSAVAAEFEPPPSDGHPKSPAGPDKSRVASVLFIGGNETQEQYDEQIRAQVEARWPNVAVTFRHPGWSSNWGRQLKRWKRDFDRASVVVLMRFMRTQLGREIRKLCSEKNLRWYACTGHGCQAILSAIEAAVLGGPGAGSR